MKTLAHVRTEMALHVLAYNMKRVMRILDVGGLIEGKDFFYGIPRLIETAKKSVAEL
jgi:hypothetical protein